MDKIAKRYDIAIQVYFPQAAAVENYVGLYGPNAFYDSVSQRKECCRIRKIEPLSRALSGKRAWITGLHREQAPTRLDLLESEFDSDNGLQKFSPLLDWSESEVWAYIRQFHVPYNKLHDKGYPSIGCAPCTRAIAAGQDIRSGRWWWEDPETKECGLHRQVSDRRQNNGDRDAASLAFGSGNAEANGPLVSDRLPTDSH